MSGKITFEIVATTLFGLEEVLADELQAIGATGIKVLPHAVRFDGNNEMIYKSNLHLRTAIKILKPIAFFKARNEQELYDNVKNINWQEYFGPQQTFAIDGTCSGDYFTNSMYVALKAKDAIADKFRALNGIRPSVDIDSPDMRINVRVQDVSVTVSLDSSGVSLNKRAYRLAQTQAPISEVLAAGMLLLSGWDKKSPLLDPMCGSGTIPIEAALLAANMAPGRLRNFAFEKWSDFDRNLWENLKIAAENAIVRNNVSIYGRDNLERAISISKDNARRAGVLPMIEFIQEDFLLSNSGLEGAHVMMNPPYGERLESDDIIEFYKGIGSKLKHSFNGCNAWIISGNLDAIKFIGLKPSKKIKLFNGPLECRFHKFELYRGSKRDIIDTSNPKQNETN